MKTQSTLMTQRQVAEMLGVTVETLRRWRAKSTGPNARRLGPRVIRYERTDVEEWLATRSGA